MAQLGPTDLTYIISFFALSRLGYAILCLSPRLASDACAKLITECEPVALIPGKTPQVDLLLTETKKLLSISIIDIVSRKQLDQSDGKGEPFARGNVDRETERSWTCCILHSSGSTGLPKAIHIPHRRLMMPIPTSPDKVEFNTFPMFHGYGNWILVHNCMNRKSTYMYNQNLPVTADRIIEFVKHVRPQVLHVVPYTLELLALSDGGVEAMKICRRVVFSGSGCPDDLGDSLVDVGVNVESMWGATEMGFLGSSSNRPPGDKAWDYIRIPKPINDHISFEHVEHDIFECIFLRSLPSLVTSNSNDPPGSFWSKDLFKKHPTIKNAWKHIGRLDDRLTLANGEKVLPLPIEGRIRQNPLVREAVVFGIGRSLPGVLIFRNDESANLNDHEFIDSIWPTVQAANARAETFSQISKETIILMGAKVDYPATDKESIKRAQVYAKFSEDIEAMYDRLAYLGTGTMQLDRSQIESWLLQMFKDHTDVSLSSINDDFFGAGIDSLQAIQMRGLILRHIDLGGNVRKLGPNIVFDTGTVARLAQRIQSIQSCEELSDESQEAMKEMFSLVEKYSSFKRHSVGTKQVDGKIVLLTGVTGSLGAQLLAQCLDNPSIKHIYCLVRGSDPTHRVISALQKHMLNEASSERFTAITADLADPLLGLSEQRYSSLQSSVTHIIHSAWAVNFNLGVRSFESQHIGGVHNLLQMALSSPYSEPAAFYFCSSIAAALATPAPAVIPEGPIENLAHALPQGYARSKLVAEHIVRNASQEFGAPTMIFRIGQIVGDKRTGLWNDTEAIPLIIRSALTMKALPEFDETESWLPVDTLAITICELAGLRKGDQSLAEHQNNGNCSVYNLQNPSKFHWSKDLLPELTRLGFEFDTVSPLAWLGRLRAYGGDVETNPAVKLLEHFEKHFADGQIEENGKAAITFELETALKNSESLRTAPDLLLNGYIQKFVTAWSSKWKGHDKGVSVESSG